MTTVKENRGGARVANPDYKKIRRDVFNMVEQLVCSNTILTASLQHNEVLQKKCLNRIQDMKAKIADYVELEEEYKITKYKYEELSVKMMSISELEYQIEYLKAADLDDTLKEPPPYLPQKKEN